MKYFQVFVDENYVPPIPLKWYGIIDKKTLERKKVYQLPKHLLFLTDRHMQMVFTDVVSFPCFMVSEMVRDVIKKYEPSVDFLRLILFDKERKRSRTYYIPYLEKVKPATESIAGGRNNGHVLVEKESLNGKCIAEIADRKKYKVVMRMDLVESILRRGAVGIGLEEIPVI